jgi:cytochrome c-type biogenesis protein CcmF
MFLTGVGPLLAWRKASTNSLKRNFLWPAVIALAGGVALYGLGVRHFYAWLSLVMSTFVAITIVREFYKGARARSHGTGENFLQSVVNLTLGNTRRYGGYVIHFGFVLLFVGWAGQAFKVEMPGLEAGIGETFTLNQYVFRVDDLSVQDTPNYVAQRASVSVFENGTKVAVMHPERRAYKAGEQQTTSEVSMRSTAREDLYLVFQGGNLDGSKALFLLYMNPLVAWVWIGGVVLGIGTMIAMLPNKKFIPKRPRAVPAERVKEDERSECKPDRAQPVKS